jgi:hypothetical protein
MLEDKDQNFKGDFRLSCDSLIPTDEQTSEGKDIYKIETPKLEIDTKYN